MKNIQNGRMYVNELKNKSLEEVIDFHIKIYKCTMNIDPDVILVSDKEFPEEIEVLGVKLIPDRFVNKNNLWIGQEYKYAKAS